LKLTEIKGIRQGGVAFSSISLALAKRERRFKMGKLMSYLMTMRRSSGTEN
jgi:hypothetical protein